MNLLYMSPPTKKRATTTTKSTVSKQNSSLKAGIPISHPVALRQQGPPQVLPPQSNTQALQHDLNSIPPSLRRHTRLGEFRLHAALSTVPSPFTCATFTVGQMDIVALLPPAAQMAYSSPRTKNLTACRPYPASLRVTSTLTQTIYPSSKPC